MKPYLYADLQIFLDIQDAIKWDCPFYGWRLVLYVGSKTPVSCGIIEWKSRHTKIEQSRSLAEQIAKEMNIKIIRRQEAKQLSIKGFAKFKRKL